MDLFKEVHSYNGYQHALLITDEFSGRIFIYNLAHKSDAFDAIVDFEAKVKRQFGLSIVKIRMDNERSLVSLEGQREQRFEIWARNEGIDIELAPPYTKEPNGRIERSGGIISTKARTMRIGARLPEELWPEIWEAAVFLHNRSPSQQYNWRSPIEIQERWFRSHFRWYQPLVSIRDNDLRPDWSGIYAYGSKAYPLDPDVKGTSHKLHFKNNPRAHVGYLVGYRASNIYRIWVPALQKVITTRDVTFDEDTHFDPQDEQKEGILIQEYDSMVEVLKMPDIDPVEHSVEEFEELFLVNEARIDQNSGVEGSQQQLASTDVDVEIGLTTNSTKTSDHSGLLTPDGMPEPSSADGDQIERLGVRQDPTPGIGPLRPGDGRASWSVGQETHSVGAQGSPGDDDQTGGSPRWDTGPDYVAQPESDNTLGPSNLDDGQGEGIRESQEVETTVALESAQEQQQLLVLEASSSSGSAPKRKQHTQKELWGKEPTRQSERKHRAQDRNVFTLLEPTFEETYQPDQLDAFCGVFLATTAGTHCLYHDQLTQLPKTY